VAATIRAAVSLFALAGFYVFAFALIVGTAFGAFLLGEHFTMMYWVAAVAGFTGLFVFAKLIAVAMSRPQLKPGTNISPEDAPELWAMVTGLAQVARTRSPEQIRLVSEANAAVSEDSRLLGLIGGPGRMYLGVPLLQGLSVTQLRAVLAHEFGHYSRAHTRLGPIAYRGWQAVTTTMRALQGDDLNWLMRVFGYALRVPGGLYLLLSLAMSRSQEREADRLMVQVAGRANAQAALREIPIIAAYWNFYVRDFVGLGWGWDLAPTADDFFGGFTQLLDARAQELDSLRDGVGGAKPAEPAEKTKAEYARELLDTHPPIAERIAAMESLPDRATALADDRRASALLPAFATAAASTAEAAYVFGYRERLDWDELVARASAADDQRTANVVYRAAARVTGEPQATLGTVVALAESGRSTKLVHTVAAELNRPYEEIATEVFAVLVRAAVLQAGAARWRLSWSGPFELVTANGETFDAHTVATLLADAKTAPDAAARLTALGVDIAARPVAVTASADIGEIVGGISEMRTDETTYDVLVLDTGLVLAEKPPESEEDGWTRLSALTNSGSAAEIAARHRFMPYASMASAKDSGWLAVKATITLHDGTTLSLKQRIFSHTLTEDSAQVFRDRLAQAGGATH
jgi:Zn-dependent protease with chaperone function